jgi:hypothetical protein
VAPRFYLDLIDGDETVPDEGGMETADLDGATTHAQAVLREIRLAARLTGAPGPWEIVIRDARGRPLRRIAVS